MAANKRYKDSIIRALLNTPDNALRLYCDITKKTYDNPTVEMKSIKARFLPKLRNDISFMLQDGEPPALELVVKVININYDAMPPNLRRNEEMRGYAQFVDKVNTGQAQGLTLAEALRRAVGECIAEGILAEFFEQHRNEVESMFSLVYDEKMAKKVAFEEGAEWGMEKGMVKGMERGIEKGMDLLLQLLQQGVDPTEAIKKVKESAKELVPA